MEERSSWLPPGLESPGLEPDDRASQGGWRKPKRGSKPGRQKPVASAAESSDEEKPETGEAETPAPYDHTEDEPEPSNLDRPDEPQAGDDDQPQAAADEEPEAEEEDDPEAGDDDEPQAEADEEPEAEDEDEPEAEGEDKPEPEAEEDDIEAARSWDEEPEEDEEPPQKRRETGDPTTVDAMGQDKHRRVIGQRYGASRSKQLLYYGVFIAVVIGGYLGLKAAADQLDKAPAHDPDKAPWSRPGASQAPLGGFETGRKGPTKFQ